jgi:hypothetical protein
VLTACKPDPCDVRDAAWRDGCTTAIEAGTAWGVEAGRACLYVGAPNSYYDSIAAAEAAYCDSVLDTSVACLGWEAGVGSCGDLAYDRALHLNWACAEE